MLASWFDVNVNIGSVKDETDEFDGSKSGPAGEAKVAGSGAAASGGQHEELGVVSDLVLVSAVAGDRSADIERSADKAAGTLAGGAEARVGKRVEPAKTPVAHA